ncbi:DUF4012 domain-containing protein [Xylanimonas oleitrophica]|uniref:DUF4012 domain-containing protein n=1 Tax=Xylanimonas oleitrophica TaxID=2607479 RepID=UPI0011B6CF0B|nr:DUF4012 domain-containing protein [Xylanimonas oleitrophica]
MLLVLAVCALLLARDARAASRALTSAGDRMPALEAAASGDGDPAALSAQLAALQRDTGEARAATGGPLWAAAAHLPAVGPTLHAVAVIAAALDDVAHDVAPVLVDARETVALTARTPDGGLDLDALRAVAPRVQQADATLTDVRSRLGQIDADEVMDPLAQPMETLRGRVDDLASTVATADRAATLLPAMLGADGPRTYLLLAMNNAELRTAGGIPGALALLRADGGRIEVVRQVSTGEVGPFPTPVLPLDPQAAAVFTERLGTHVQDLTLTPEFPTTATLAAGMWAASQGEDVDGVLATDPVALAHLLRVTGPVEVAVPPDAAARFGSPTVTVGPDDAVALLENQIYTVLEPEQADAFYAQVTAAVLGRLGSPDIAPADVLPALRQAAAERRLLVWSARPDERQRLDGTLLAGAFLSSPSAAGALGVFLDDTVVGKMTWYLDSSVHLVSSRCTAQGRLDTVDVTLASTAPADAGTVLPRYVAGPPGGDVPPGTVRAVLRVAAPRDADAPRLQRDPGGAAIPLGAQTARLDGRHLASTTVTLAPGDSTTVRVESLLPHAATAAPGGHPTTLDVWSTPTAHAGGLLSAPVPACG